MKINFSRLALLATLFFNACGASKDNNQRTSLSVAGNDNLEKKTPPTIPQAPVTPSTPEIAKVPDAQPTGPQEKISLLNWTEISGEVDEVLLVRVKS